MLARRLLILAIVLLLVSAVAASLAPRQVAPALPPSPDTLPVGDTVVREIPAADGANTQVEVHRGQLLDLEVQGDVLDTVLLEQLDRLDGITPESPAHFNVLIDAPAGYSPIRLVDADRRIGAIQITE